VLRQSHSVLCAAIPNCATPFYTLVSAWLAAGTKTAAHTYAQIHKKCRHGSDAWQVRVMLHARLGVCVHACMCGA